MSAMVTIGAPGADRFAQFRLPHQDHPVEGRSERRISQYDVGHAERGRGALRVGLGHAPCWLRRSLLSAPSRASAAFDCLRAALA